MTTPDSPAEAPITVESSLKETAWTDECYFIDYSVRYEGVVISKVSVLSGKDLDAAIRTRDHLYPGGTISRQRTVTTTEELTV